MRTRELLSVLVLVSLLLLLSGLGLLIGSVETTMSDIWNAMISYSDSSAEHYAIVQLRMPRLFAALFVGAALSLSGYLMQTMVNNPLADPYLLGTSSGASVGASIVYAGAIPMYVWTVSLFSFFGALVVTLVALVVSNEKGRIQPAKLLLSGLALSALMVATTSLITVLSGEEQRVKNILFWTLGGLEGVSWSHIPLLGSAVVVLLFFFYFYSKQLTILLLGEERAENLGVNTRAMRWLVVIAAALATGLSVSVAGPIGFVGLVIPHFARAFYGVEGRYTILYTAAWGGVFLLACDVLSKVVFYPIAIPLGITTSFVGIPFFIFLLGKNKFKI